MIAHKRVTEQGDKMDWAALVRRVKSALRRLDTYIGAILMGIAIWIMTHPGLPLSGRNFLLVLFACLALIPEKKIRKS